jgi:hypothetical protein
VGIKATFAIFVGLKFKNYRMDISRFYLDAHYHILVTGGARFIGSNLCAALLLNGN